MATSILQIIFFCVRQEKAMQTYMLNITISIFGFILF